MPDAPIDLTFSRLRERHAAVFFDAYGVLVDSTGALPGAVEAIRALNATGQPFLIVTNDASRSGENAAARYRRLNLDVTPTHILSSGMMIAPALRETVRPGDRVVVLGPADAAGYAREAGVTVMAPIVDDPADVVVVADEGGFDLLDTMDDTLSMIVTAITRGRAPRLLLANPDLIYPAGPGSFGVTAGSIALVIEHALRRIFGTNAPTFEPLGKPAARIFQEAMARVGTTDAVMIGDQLETDIMGANAVGLSSALMLGGVTTRDAAVAAGADGPTYILTTLEG